MSPRCAGEQTSCCGKVTRQGRWSLPCTSTFSFASNVPRCRRMRRVTYRSRRSWGYRDATAVRRRRELTCRSLRAVADTLRSGRALSKRSAGRLCRPRSSAKPIRHAVAESPGRSATRQIPVVPTVQPRLPVRGCSGRGMPASLPRATRGCTYARGSRFCLAGSFVIGRAAEAAIQIDSGGVCGCTAILVSARGLYRDLGSKNGPSWAVARPGPGTLHDVDEVRGARSP